MTVVKIYGSPDEGTIAQIERCSEGAYGVLCADAHLGYSQPIGGAIGYEDQISPSGVGFDIGCGNKAVKTDINLHDFEDGDLSGIADSIAERIAFGMGRNAVSKIEGHPVLDKIEQAELKEQRLLFQSARNQLGTVGSGNHYVDVFADEDDDIWVGVHFGSRGFGHKTASGFLALAQGKEWGEKYSEGSMDALPTLISTKTDLGQAYIEAMNLAGEYAYAGRDVVVDEVLDILGGNVTFEVHNHHNFAWKERHFGRDLWVVRKGCTPAYPGQQGFVGGSMGDISVILEGTNSYENALGMYSTVHGAGRVMSRTKAAGKVRRRKRWECSHRDCKNTFQIDGISSHNPAPKSGICPDHPDFGVRKVWIEERLTEGAIDWSSTLTDLHNKGIILRGGGADEAPLAYRPLRGVLEAQGDTIQVLHELRPLIVVMAGADLYDPFKD